jgi:Zn-dependent peptidase ImmA (M78 family)
MHAFRAKNQVNVKKQMINYRASLRMQVYLRAPGRYAGKEEKKKQKETTTTTKTKRKKEDRTDLVSETTTLSSPAL